MIPIFFLIGYFFLCTSDSVSVHGDPLLPQSLVSAHQLGDAASVLMPQLMMVIGIMETGAIYQKIKE